MAANFARGKDSRMEYFPRLLAVRRQPTDAVLHPAHISRASGDVAGLFATSPLARLPWFVNQRFPWVGTHG